jgi:putative membrane protein
VTRGAEQQQEIMMMFDYGDHMSGANWAFMGVSMVLFWGLLIVGIVVLVRYLRTDGTSRHRSPPAHPANPEELLAERFARGEIGEQEYHERLETLRSGARAPVSSSPPVAG